jgi:hypothetical protein
MADDDVFLPYRNFATLLEKGGLKNVFQTEDLVPTITVVDKLYQQRAALVQTIYEVTGISDVIRGASNPNETATAQRIKGQFGSLRLQKRQKAVQIFIRDLYRLKAEIIAEHFTREQLQEMTGIDMPTKAEQMMAKQRIAAIQQQVQMAQQSQQQMQAYQQQMQQMQQASQQQGAMPNGAGAGMPPTQAPQGQAGPGALPNMQQPGQPGMMGMGMPPMPQMVPMPQIDPDEMQGLFATATAVVWEDIAEILRSNKSRAYKVDIETENTAQMDSDMEKQQRIEFLSTMQGMIERVVPMIMQAPALAPLAKELTMFGVGAFKIGRTLEEGFSDTFDQLQQMAQQAQQKPQIDPLTQAKTEQIKAQTQSTMMTTQAKVQGAQVDNALKQADLIAQQESQATERMKTQAEMQNQQLDREAAAQEKAADFGIRMQEQKREDVRLAHEIGMDQHTAKMDVHTAHLDRQDRAEERHYARQDSDMQREASMQDRRQSAEAHQQDMMHRDADHQDSRRERAETQHDRDLDRRDRDIDRRFTIAERSQKMRHADAGARQKEQASRNADAKAKRDSQRPPGGNGRRPI